MPKKDDKMSHKHIASFLGMTPVTHLVNHPGIFLYKPEVPFLGRVLHQHQLVPPVLAKRVPLELQVKPDQLRLLQKGGQLG